MIFATLLLAGLTLGAPAPGGPAGVCDQINGTYVDGRLGLFNADSMLAFDRLKLAQGVGEGHQLTTRPSQPGGTHVLLRVTVCRPLAPNRAQLVVETALAGTSVYSGPIFLEATVFDAGARVWIRGTIPNAEFPGWLLRVPPPPPGV